MKKKIDKKLALSDKQNLNLTNLSQNVLKICREGVLNFGKISPVYLMRKLKCSYPEAYEIMQEFCKYS